MDDTKSANAQVPTQPSDQKMIKKDQQQTA